MKSLPGTCAMQEPDTLPADTLTLRHDREGLIELFGSEQMVDRLLDIMREVNSDLATLARLQSSLDARAVADQLHRIVGCVAFLGGPESETQVASLIAAVRQRGVAVNRQALEDFHKEVLVCLNKLTSL